MTIVTSRSEMLEPCIHWLIHDLVHRTALVDPNTGHVRTHWISWFCLSSCKQPQTLRACHPWNPFRSSWPWSSPSFRIRKWVPSNFDDRLLLFFCIQVSVMISKNSLKSNIPWPWELPLLSKSDLKFGLRRLWSKGVSRCVHMRHVKTRYARENVEDCSLL